jgi:hypothetical protein
MLAVVGCGGTTTTDATAASTSSTTTAADAANAAVTPKSTAPACELVSESPLVSLGIDAGKRNEPSADECRWGAASASSPGLTLSIARGATSAGFEDALSTASSDPTTFDFADGAAVGTIDGGSLAVVQFGLDTVQLRTTGSAALNEATVRSLLAEAQSRLGR